MTRIFDNLSPATTLGPHLQASFPAWDRLDTAVGYFDLRGWSMFADLVQAKLDAGASELTALDGQPLPLVRVLIGMVIPSSQETVVADLQSQLQLDEDTRGPRVLRAQRSRELLEHLREQLTRGMPTAADRLTLGKLREQIRSGAVAVRVYTARPLHGKTYVFRRDSDINHPHLGFVGSSNLTRAGLTTNLELNVDVVDWQASERLAQWFHMLWEDRNSVEVSADLLELLEETWAASTPRPPFDVFMKVCFDLSRDVRDGQAEYSIPPEVAGKLLKYQATAVRTLCRRVMARRGTMLGDVVGLGKTLVAIAVALALRDEHGFRTLVLCPKNLEQMWLDHLEAYGLHSAKVVTYSRAHADLPKLRGRYAFVVADESHTLRNESTRTYAAIADYLAINDSRVLLLTATPYNLHFTDVANQLALYLGPDDDLGVTPTAALSVDPSLVQKVDGKTSTLTAFRLSDQPEDWRRLMSEHLVRRTRSFITRTYAVPDASGTPVLEFSDGGTFRFPVRDPRPMQHEFAADDPALAMTGDDVLDDIRSLQLPRYTMARFLAPGAKRSDEEQRWAQNVTAGGGHVAGFVRTLLYKRLSSCGYSFLLSLRKHLARNELFSYALAEKLPLPTGTIDDALIGDLDPTDAEEVTESQTNSGGNAGQRYEALRTASSPSITWVGAHLFTSDLARTLGTDSQVLRKLLSRFGTWHTGKDSKLAALLKLITSDHKDEKVLVFTEYQDTATYVAAALAAAGVGKVGVATGSSDDPTRLARRFSPRSAAVPHEAPPAPDEELRVLIATDVLSEGQNLQDAHIVVNYDLPWAIIRLIQRAGRVDRVGQESPRVQLYTFFHQSLEGTIGLRSRVAARLGENAAAFGSDEQFFGSDSEVQQLTDLYTGKLDSLEPDDDVDAASQAYELWQKACASDPTLASRIERMPDLVDATRLKRLTDFGDGVACFVRTFSGQDGFAFVRPSSQTVHDPDIRLLTGQEALKVFEASATDPGHSTREDHDALVSAAVRGPLQTAGPPPSGNLHGVRRIIWNRLGGQLRDPTDEVAEPLDALWAHPLTADAERRIRRLIRSGGDDGELEALVRILFADRGLVREGSHNGDPIRIITSLGVLPR